jgi:hypothetical protein
MKIRSFEVWNFKSIEYSKEILLPKLTILIGPNSSGKSSILQSLLVMKQTVEAEDPSLPLVLNGPYIQLGEYEDFIHGRDSSLPFTIKFNFWEYKKKPSKPYVCDVCGKPYNMKVWFLKHVEENHPTYWTKKRDDISREDYHLPKRPSLRFQYRFNPETSTIILQELELENPPPVEGLILSSIKIVQLKSNAIRIQVISLNGNQIYAKEHKLPENIEVVDYNVMVRLFDYFTFRSYFMFSKGDSKKNEQISLLEDDLSSVVNDNFLDEKLTDASGNPRLVTIGDIFRTLKDVPEPGFSLLSRLNRVSFSLRRRLDNVTMFLHGMSHIGPLRPRPERIYFGTGGKPTTVGVKGEFIQDIFWRDKRIGHETLINNLNDWLENLNFDSKLNVVPLGVGEIYQLKVMENGLSLNIADVGFGLSQILPVLTECINFSLRDISRDIRLMKGDYPRIYKGKEEVNRLFITEQPEIHLNPKIQAALADFFIQLGDQNRMLLIETHSEHIITRIQRRVAEGSLNPEDAIIYYISKHDNKSEIEKISISPKGEFSYWPKGFFQDDLEDAIEIIKKSHG